MWRGTFPTYKVSWRGGPSECLSGPVAASDSGKLEQQLSGSRGSCSSANLFPRASSAPGAERLGEPLADAYEVLGRHDDMTFALADGCGFGFAKKQAACRAAASFVATLGKETSPDSRDIVQTLNRALTVCHEDIIKVLSPLIHPSFVSIQLQVRATMMSIAPEHAPCLGVSWWLSTRGARVYWTRNSSISSVALGWAMYTASSLALHRGRVPN